MDDEFALGGNTLYLTGHALNLLDNSVGAILPLSEPLERLVDQLLWIRVLWSVDLDTRPLPRNRCTPTGTARPCDTFHLLDVVVAGHRFRLTLDCSLTWRDYDLRLAFSLLDTGSGRVASDSAWCCPLAPVA